MKYLKTSFNKMEPYFSKNIDDGIILNANESPFNPPIEVINSFKESLEQFAFNRYPDMQCEMLCEAIAKHFNVLKEQVTCGVGSDELLEVTFRAALEVNDKVLSFSPSFSMYRVFADLALAKFIEVKFNDDLTFCCDNMLKAIKKENPKLIMICSPNNPTGAFLSEQDIIKIVECSNALVLLDLAYIDFADEDYTYLATQYDNLIVYRTFSKALALPSIRVGYAISKKTNIDMINAVKAPYSVTGLSLILATKAIENYNLYENNINIIKNERDKLYTILKEGGFLVYPSKANFLYLKLNDQIYNDLVENKIYIRKFKNDFYRITIGSVIENIELLKVVMKYAKK